RARRSARDPAPARRARPRRHGRRARLRDARPVPPTGRERDLRDRTDRRVRRLPGAGRRPVRDLGRDDRVPAAGTGRARAGAQAGAEVNARLRLALFVPAAAILGPVLVWGLSGLPAFGAYHGPSGIGL